ncbi:MAG: hypothetical protein GQ469_00560 [Methanosarcinales archaeon]|nr:hypothetical protein [Methanosarcinales archaeon]
MIDSRVLSVLESVLSSSIFNNENNVINQKYVNISELEITEFERYLKIRKGLSDSTVKLYLRLFRQFVKNVRKESVTSRDIEDYLSKSRSKRNDLAMLKALFRDFIGIDIEWFFWMALFCYLIVFQFVPPIVIPFVHLT